MHAKIKYTDKMHLLLCKTLFDKDYFYVALAIKALQS